MSRAGEIVQDWGGEAEQPFRLGIGQLRKLQERVDAGPLGIAARCNISLAILKLHSERDWFALSRLDLNQAAEHHHVREVILQGLLGAGVALPVADKKVREWVDERPLSENLVIALNVCMASIYGVEDEEPLGEPEAAQAASPTSPTESSDLARTASTPSAAPSASAPERSTP